MLKLNHVNYQYTNRHYKTEAIKDVCAEFEQGKFYTIIGKSGSGKTTLISLIAALDNPTSGEVLYNGSNLSVLNASDYRLRKTAVIYQSYNLFPLLTIIENVLLPLQIQKENKFKAKEDAISALKLVGLDEKYYKRYPSMLSGGEQQRVAIARALAAGAEMLIADEPTGNLDTDNTLAIVSIFCKLAHEENKLVITVTHDLEIAAQADVTFEMIDGKLQKSNTNGLIRSDLNHS